MATLLIQQPLLSRRACTPPPTSNGLMIDQAFKSRPIPNKHLPYCFPGPTPTSRPRSLEFRPSTPPTSPRDTTTTSSLLYPAASRYARLSDDPSIYSIDAAALSSAMTYAATQSLPDPSLVFPWLHGLHKENALQLSFFVARRKSLRRVPRCLRGLTVLKCGGNLHRSKLKGALKPEEVLAPAATPTFFNVDPKEGFSVRNFHIQTAKMAMVSDVVVYRDTESTVEELLTLAARVARAQKGFRERAASAGMEVAEYNVFVVSSPFEEFERNHLEIVAIDSQQRFTGKVMDFFQQERFEMNAMSSASEIAPNVFLGHSPTDSDFQAATAAASPAFDVFIEASDTARIPATFASHLKHMTQRCQNTPVFFDFPASGCIMPPTWCHTEVDALMDMCAWIHRMAEPDHVNSIENDHGNTISTGSDDGTKDRSRPLRILIHCPDGYTETTLLAMTYFMFAHALPLAPAWIALHRDRHRNFFAYPSDVALLKAISPRILAESPAAAHNQTPLTSAPASSSASSCSSPISSSSTDSMDAASTSTTPSPISISMDSSSIFPPHLPLDPPWLHTLDGSLPSRITDYMYLGNVAHANNIALLAALGISRVLSVGEPLAWSPNEERNWAQAGGEVLRVEDVQDNGVDGLGGELERCLAFIEQGRREDSTTLVHCRVGVSRSATICIAEIMSSMRLSFPRAYCFVRARRLNVIIQPHLRFAYELLRFEEALLRQRKLPVQRELEWASISREIAAMNRPYVK